MVDTPPASRGEPPGTRSRTAPAWLRWFAATVAVTPLLRWAVLVHSVPPEEPWRAACPHCGTRFWPAGPWPGGGAAESSAGLGALLPAGRCAGCHRRIGAPAYALELTTLAAAALVVIAVVGGGRSPWVAVAFAGWAVAVVALSFVDLAVHRLPDRLTLPAAGWVLAWLGVDALLGDSGGSWLRALIAAGGCGLGFALITLVFGARGFGLGDAKMALGAGALLGWLGWTALVAGLFLSFLASGLIATALLVTRRVGRKDTLPFGPFLAAGTLATLAWVGLS